MKHISSIACVPLSYLYAYMSLSLRWNIYLDIAREHPPTMVSASVTTSMDSQEALPWAAIKGADCLTTVVCLFPKRAHYSCYTCIPSFSSTVSLHVNSPSLLHLNRAPNQHDRPWGHQKLTVSRALSAGQTRNLVNTAVAPAAALGSRTAETLVTQILIIHGLKACRLAEVYCWEGEFSTASGVWAMALILSLQIIKRLWSSIY